MLKQIANAVLFQIGWFACVMGGSSYWLLLAVAVLLVHLLWISSWAAEGKLLLWITALGIVLDSLLMHVGVFGFGNESLLIPLWLIVLWPVLATTLNHCLAWTAQPWWRASLLGATSAPLSYYAGAQLAGVALPYGTATTLLVLALIWAAVFPLLHRLAHRG